MARAQGLPSGEPPGAHLLRCVILQEMRVWPLEAAIQVEASNHRKLRR